jgi:flagellar motor switch protein FliM
VSTEGSDVAQPVISDEEAAALLDDGDAAKGGVKPYDLAGSIRITRGRLPALEMIHESFARSFRIVLFTLLQRDVQLTFGGVRPQKSVDFLATVRAPASLTVAKLSPLPGNVLFVFDPRLIFQMVDAYFGGPGKATERSEDSGLTPTEVRFVQRVLRQAAEDLTQAWAPVAQVQVELVKHESNPLFASVAAPTDSVLVSRFHVDMPSGGGTLDLVIPAATIEPVREVLTAGIAANTGGSETWGPALHAHLAHTLLELRAVLTESELSIGDLLRLRPGDVIPIDPPGDVVLYAADTPLLNGRIGLSRGRNALKVAGPAVRPGA